jgi:Site-specific DNA methylase
MMPRLISLYTGAVDPASFLEGEADALIGGPPCQPFSKSGY